MHYTHTYNVSILLAHRRTDGCRYLAGFAWNFSDISTAVMIEEPNCMGTLHEWTEWAHFRGHIYSPGSQNDWNMFRLVKLSKDYSPGAGNDDIDCIAILRTWMDILFCKFCYAKDLQQLNYCMFNAAEADIYLSRDEHSFRVPWEFWPLTYRSTWGMSQTLDRVFSEEGIICIKPLFI